MTFSSISFIYLYLPLAIIIFRLTPAHRRVACLTLLSWCLLSAGKCSGGADPGSELSAGFCSAELSGALSCPLSG